MPPLRAETTRGSSSTAPKIRCGISSEGRTLRGKTEVLQWMDSTYIQPPENSVDTMIAEGESLVVIGTITTTDGSTETTSQYCDVWTFRQGKLAAVQAFVV